MFLRVASPVLANRGNAAGDKHINATVDFLVIWCGVRNTARDLISCSCGRRSAITCACSRICRFAFARLRRLLQWGRTTPIPAMRIKAAYTMCITIAAIRGSHRRQRVVRRAFLRSMLPAILHVVT